MSSKQPRSYSAVTSTAGGNTGGSSAGATNNKNSQAKKESAASLEIKKFLDGKLQEIYN